MPQRSRHQSCRLVASLSGLLFIGTSFGFIHSSQSERDKGGLCLKGAGRHGRLRPVRLDSSALMDGVVDKRPVERPGPLGKNNLRGVVRVEVLINERGEVVCAHAIQGHPMAFAPAVRSIREWTFKPYSVGGKRRLVVGILTVPFDFASRSQKTN